MAIEHVNITVLIMKKTIKATNLILNNLYISYTAMYEDHLH